MGIIGDGVDESREDKEREDAILPGSDEETEEWPEEE